MTKNIILVLSAIALIGIGLLIGVYGVGNSFGATSYDVSDLVGDVYQGKNHTLVFKDGIFQGAPITALSVIGSASIGSTLGVTGTTTISSGLTLGKSALCIDAFATSTATKIKIEFNAAAATSTSPIGGLMLNYGSCN